MQIHATMEEGQEFATLQPQQQQLAVQARDAHVQAHQEMVNQEGSGAGRQSLPSESSEARSILSVTRANAQNTANAVQASVKANAQ
jgi:hypothetical protein